MNRQITIMQVMEHFGFAPNEKGSIYLAQAVGEILDGAHPDIAIWRKVVSNTGRSLESINNTVRKSIKKAQAVAPMEWEKLLDGFPLARPYGTTLAFRLANWMRSS